MLMQGKWQGKKKRKHKHLVIAGKYDEKATSHYVRSDDITRSVGVYSCTTVEKVCGHLLGIEDNKRLSNDIEIHNVT